MWDRFPLENERKLREDLSPHDAMKVLVWLSESASSTELQLRQVDLPRFCGVYNCMIFQITGVENGYSEKFQQRV